MSECVSYFLYTFDLLFYEFVLLILTNFYINGSKYDLLHYSRVKSAQQIMGSLIKDHLSKRWQLAPKSIYHLTLMPCFDKKLEASRNDFYNEALDSHDVDMVITTIEVEQMLQEDGVNLAELPTSQLDFCKGKNF